MNARIPLRPKFVIAAAALGILLALVAAQRPVPAALAQGAPPSSARPEPPPGSRPGPPGAMPGRPGGPPSFAPAPVDSFVAERDSITNRLLERIAGREDAPAESVFKDIRVMKGMPAGRVLRIMNFGYGRSLGVRCQHCHVADRWEAEDRPQKQIARDMMALVRTINEGELPKIKNLQSEHPGVNCTTCHRGQRKPAMNM